MFPWCSLVSTLFLAFLRVLSRNLLSWEPSASDDSRSPGDFRCPPCVPRNPALPSRQLTLQHSREPATFVHRRQFSRKHVSAAPQARIEAKQSAEKKKPWISSFWGNKNFFYCFLSVLVYFVSFMDCSRERTGRRRREGRNGTGNSSKQQEQQRTINKIPIDDEARLMHTCGRSVLASKPKNFLASARFSANENISIELVQWNRTERPRKKPGTTIAQRHRN